MKFWFSTLLLFWTLSCNTSNDAGMQSDKFPRIEATTLSGQKVVFPDITHGKTALILIAFKRQAQGIIDSWRAPFEEHYGNDSNFVFYEIPMISSSWKLMSSMIDSGMRSGVPKRLHDHVATYYGPLDKYYTLFGISDNRDAYAFLLDQHGNIIYSGHGPASAEKIKDLKNIASTNIQKSE